MHPSTARTLVIATCLLAGCGAPTVTSGPAPDPTTVNKAALDPATLAQLDAFTQEVLNAYPTTAPTYAPTYPPTAEPTYEPTYPPTAEPTYLPTAEPTYEPTYPPTAEPTYAPTYPPTYPPKDCGCKVTGGGRTQLYGGTDVNFGFNAQHDKDGDAKGHLNVVIKAGRNNTHFLSDAITDIDCQLDPLSAHPRLTGTVTITGTLKGGGTFIWQVVDTGEPGVLDRVKFTVNDQVLFDNDLNANGAGPGGGNIQIHRENCD